MTYITTSFQIIWKIHKNRYENKTKEMAKKKKGETNYGKTDTDVLKPFDCGTADLNGFFVGRKYCRHLNSDEIAAVLC